MPIAYIYCALHSPTPHPHIPTPSTPTPPHLPYVPHPLPPHFLISSSSSSSPNPDITYPLPHHHTPYYHLLLITPSTYSHHSHLPSSSSLPPPPVASVDPIRDIYPDGGYIHLDDDADIQPMLQPIRGQQRETEARLRAFRSESLVHVRNVLRSRSSKYIHQCLYIDLYIYIYIYISNKYNICI